MGEPGPNPNITLDAALSVFDELSEPCTPLTASEVGDELGCTRRTAHRKLKKLAERGDLESKKAGAHSRVWWRPISGDESLDADPDEEHVEQFAEFVSVVKDYAIFKLDPDGYITTWNEGANRIKGYEEDEILGEHFSIFYTKEDREADVPNGNLAAAAEQGRVEDEGWRVRKDGTRFWANVVVTAIYDDAGGVKGFTKVTRDLTERKRTEDALRREREFLDQLFDASPVGIATFTGDGEVTRSNPRATEILGVSEDNVDGNAVGERPVFDEDGYPVPPEDRPFARVFETGDAVEDWTCQIERPDGQRRWVDVNVAPILDDGEVEQVVATVEDITKRKEQEKRLERRRDELEAELGDVFERVDDAFYALDEDWRFTYVNDRGEDLLQHTEAELLGESIWEAFPEAKDGVVWEKYREAIETQEPVSFELYYEPLDFWAGVNAYPSETGLSVYFRNVTERVERERELEQYETIVESLWDGIYALDPDERFVMVNDALLRMTGYEREELLGKPGSVVHNETINESARDLSEEVAAGDRDSAALEFQLQTSDGESIPVETRFGPYQYEDDTYARTGVVRDITERVEREQELEEYVRIVETVEDGVYVLDEHAEFRRVNDAFVSMTRFDRSELLGAHASIVFGETFEKLDEKARHELEAGAEVSTLEERIFTAGGEEITVESRVTQFDVEDRGGRVGVVRDVTERKERERQLERSRNQLATLNDLNELVNEVSNLAIESSTREEIERQVCTSLADSDSYEFAWIGELDRNHETVTMRTEAGVDGYLDSITIRVDESPEGRGPTGRAVRTGEIQTAQNIPENPEYDAWRDHADEHGFRASAAIPIEHEGTLYGVLNVYSRRPNAFQEDERAVVGRLGEIVGHAINAIERKQALMSEDVVEVRFQIENLLDNLGVESEGDGVITFDRAVPVSDGVFLEYGTVTRDSVDTLEALVDRVPHFESLRLLTDTSDPARFELRLDEPPAISTVASYGGRVDSAAITDGDYRMVVQIPPSADVRRVVDAVQAEYPDARVIAQRQTTRSKQSAARLESALVEELTEKQKAALESAYFSGFFEWPRDSSGEAVAASMNLSAPTFHQHVRTAERKLLRMVFEAEQPKALGSA